MKYFFTVCDGWNSATCKWNNETCKKMETYYISCKQFPSGDLWKRWSENNKLVNNILRKYNGLKEETKNPGTSAVYIILKNGNLLYQL